MKIKVVILDDEQLAIDYLRIDLQRHHPEVEIIAEFVQPTIAIEYVLNHSFDLLFLDIQMPGMSGVDFLQQLGNFKFQVVFTTAYSQYAIDAIKLKAVDYLLKPIDPVDLNLAIQRVKENLRTKINPEKIVISDQHSLEFISLDKIEYCMADKNYTYIYLKDKGKKTITKNLGEFEKLLNPEKFIRIHQSYLVNISSISKIMKGDNAEIVLESGAILPISRQKRKEVMDLLLGS